jgi:hypothetical protein
LSVAEQKVENADLTIGKGLFEMLSQVPIQKAPLGFTLRKSNKSHWKIALAGMREVVDDLQVVCLQACRDD